MFGSGYWVYPEVDGVRFCYAKAPTYRCPLLADLDRPIGALLAEGAPAALPYGDAAKLLGMDPAKLRSAIARQHRSSHEVRARVDGKLTDRCAVCGHRLERLGFRVWREERVPEEALTSEQRVSGQISARLGGDGVTWRTTESRYLDTKREAAGWARENYQTAKAATEVTA